MGKTRTRLTALKTAVLLFVTAVLMLPAVAFAAPEYADVPPPAGASSGTGPVWISSDGRYVTFSGAYDYIGDGNGGGQFMRDRQTGALTRLSSLDPNHATIVQLTPDLRYALLYTDISLVPQDTNGAFDTYMLDRTTGSYELVTKTNSGGIGNGDSVATALDTTMSTDGRYVAFYSWATNMESTPSPAGSINIYMRDRVAQTTTLISADSSGNAGGGQSDNPVISRDGSTLTFETSDSGIDSAAGTYGLQIEAVNLATGARTRVSAAQGTPDTAGSCGHNTLSSDGRYVAFACSQSLTGNGDTNGDIYRYDRQTNTLLALGQNTGTNIAANSKTRVHINGDGSRVIFNASRSTSRWDIPSHTTAPIDSNDQEPILSESGLVMAAQELSNPSRSGVWPLPPITLPDTTPPTITATPDRTANANGWYSAPVTVTFTCTDNVAVASCPSPQTVSADGANQVISGTATDTAGNTASTSVTLNIDKTAPTVSNTNVTPNFVLFAGTLNISATAADALSGVANGEYYLDTDPGQGSGTPLAYNSATNTLNGTKAVTFGSLSVGNHTVYIRAQDNAGNWSTVISKTFFYL